MKRISGVGVCASHLGSVLVIITAPVLIGLWYLFRRPTGLTILRIIKYYCPFRRVDICTEGAKAMINQILSTILVQVHAVHQTVPVVTVLFTTMKLQLKKSPLKNAFHEAIKIIDF